MNNNIITEDNCVEHYKLDIELCKKQLAKYDKNVQKSAFTYAVLLDTFVVMLQDKYQVFIDDLIDDMPECDLDIYKDLEDGLKFNN